MTRWRLIAATAGVLSLASTGWAAVTTIRLDAAQAAAHAGALRADSIAAVADSTKVVLADSLRTVYERRMVQIRMERDSIDRELRTESRARTALALAVRELRAEQATDTVFVEAGDVRYGHTQIRREPWLAQVEAWLPPPPRAGRFALRVELDPAPIYVGVRCGEAAGSAEVRPAHVTVDAPAWLTARVEDPVVAPTVCNPPLRTFSFLDRITIGTPALGIGAGVGLIAGLLIGGSL